jgi:hypothetical protein
MSLQQELEFAATVCREFAATIAAGIAATITAIIAATIAAKLQKFFFQFCCDLFRAFTASIAATITATIAAVIAAKMQNFFFIFCRDLCRVFAANIAATITANIAATIGSSSYYTLDDAGSIVTDRAGRGARQYLLELVTVHVRNVYEPSTYRDGVIEQIISAFHSRYPMLEHLAVSSVWLRRMILSHIANRRSGYTRAARAVLDREAAGLPPRDDGGRPRTVHDAEWRAALARGA